MDDRLAVLGCGRMGTILAEGLIRRGGLSPAQISVTTRRPEKGRQLEARFGFSVAASNEQAADGADIVVIAVKPADVQGVLRDIARTITRRHLVISIAAGVSTSSLLEGLPMAGPMVRAMPNVAALVGKSMTAICGGERSGELDLEKAETLFSAVGRVVRLPEHLMDPATALSGSGPGIVAYFVEAMTEAGTELGLSETVSLALIVQTLLGTGALLEEEMTAVELREAVTSPGGTTQAAIETLQSRGAADALREAIKAGADRARELSR